ncbi:hypothetical protein JCM8097_005760 [Rhodosporidiobolus ruineniae]
MSTSSSSEGASAPPDDSPAVLPISPTSSQLSPPPPATARPFLHENLSDSTIPTAGEARRGSYPPTSPFARFSRSSIFGTGALLGVPRSNSDASLTPLGDTARAIQAGEIGGDFGPYPRHQSISSASPLPLFSRRGSHMSFSDVAVDLVTSPSSYSVATPDPLALRLCPRAAPRPGGEVFSTHHPPTEDMSTLPGSPSPPFLGASGTGEGIRRSQLGLPSVGGPSAPEHTRFLWEKGNEDADDFVHEPDAVLDAYLDKRNWKRTSWSAAADTVSLTVVVLVVLGLFLGWPVMRYGILGSWRRADHGGRDDLGFGLGGANGSGQVPLIPNLPTLIDKDTPHDVYQITGHDGDKLNLVFSDEFNVDGRTFWPGDDPYWEAVDLHYWATQDYEWYDPDACTTKNGNLEITLSQEPNHNLNFRSGMLQSWNKFCFTGGRIEVNLSFPGTPTAMGYWPGVWTMGNLGRAGYGASNHGVWPYSYTACDVGTLPNQTYPNGTSPTAARTSGSRDYGGSLSWLPGQRFSACTCEGEDHPGPNVGVGRGAPEIDVTEQQVDWRGTGSASQSIQFAPMDPTYQWHNASPDFTIYDSNRTFQNLFTGAVYQESASVISLTDTTSYEGRGYSTFSFEYEPGADGKITWAINNTPTWQITAGAMGPNDETEIGQRLVSVEPMAINLNLAISKAFQEPQWNRLTFPGTFRIDYVRVYQKEGHENVGCDPKDYPTSAYIARHPDIYNNPNLTVFPSAFPKNRHSATGCA